MSCLGKKRDCLGIVADILQTANPSATKTRIMHDASLSFALLQKYLKKTVGSKLLNIQEGKYFITPSGKEFLTEYNIMRESYNETQKLLENLDTLRKKLERFC